MKNRIKFVLALLFLVSLNYIGMEVKAQDSTTYKSIKIGEQVWMVENLDVVAFRNGDTIPEVKTNGGWDKAGNEGKPVWCYYDNDPVNGKKYGRLYNWYAINDPRGLAPEGWHVPSFDEQKQLNDFLFIRVPGKMRSVDGWDDDCTCTNESGFTALPGGSRTNSGFFNIGKHGSWWSSTRYSNSDAWYLLIKCKDGRPYIKARYFFKKNGHSVRCVKD